MKRPGRRTKLLSQVGALVAVLFALAILVNGADSADPARLLPYLRVRIDAFTGGAEQFDDITMLGIRVNSRKGGEKERREGL